MRLSVRGVISFGALLCLLFLLWWMLRSYLFVLAFVLAISCAALSSWSLFIGKESIRVRFSMPAARVARATVFPFHIQVENPKRFVGFTADLTYRWCNVFTGQEGRGKEHIFLAPVKGYGLDLTLESRYAGRVEAQVEDFVVYDLLHLFYVRFIDRQSSGTVVSAMPTVAPEDEVYASVEGFPKENESRQRGIEYNPDYEIREYVPGDELKNIHWKLTAKQNKLMVRERLASGRQKINVLLPLGEDRQENDALMDALYYLLQLLLEKEYPVQLFWIGVNNEFRSQYIAETGEMEAIISEILSGSGLRVSGSARERMEMERPQEGYILVQTGAYKGAYIR